MYNDVIRLFETYGWVAVFLFVVALFLVKYLVNRVSVWRQRDRDRVIKTEFSVHDQLANHQFFSNLAFKLDNEIHSLTLNNKSTPIRQKLFRKLLELKLISIQEVVETIISEDMEHMNSSQWAGFINGEVHKGDKQLETVTLKAGIPSIVVSKFMVWQMRTVELLTSYVNDLAISTVYSSNMARTNTLLYLLSLQLITIIGDAEKTLGELNGEISGLVYKGEEIE